MLKSERQITVAVTGALLEIGIQPPVGGVKIEKPARPEHGDFATSVALEMARSVGRNPRDLASELTKTAALAGIPHLEAVELAGPGFINFRLSVDYLYEALMDVIDAGEQGFASSDLGGGERVQLEFVSANPTGPLHVGNAWWASFGDSLKRVLVRAGYAVSTEYYVNDTGGQIRTLGESLLARRAGLTPPEGGYRGEYVVELANRYDGPDDVVVAGNFAAKENLENIRSSLDRLGIHFDQWYSQASIEESGAVAETISYLESLGATYEKDGATWLDATRFGDNRDRVLKKSNGDFTYLAGDIAYHRNKFLVRGFERVIDIFGADHHGQVASLKAAMAALEIDPSRLEILLGQMVSLVEGDRKVKFSKRAGDVVALDWLIDQVSPSVVRLLSLSSSIDRASSIDVVEATKTSMDNPVYYIQYAHARICSIDRVRRVRGIEQLPASSVDLGTLNHPRELDLIRTLISLPEVVESAAIDRAPQKVVTWLKTFASDFHGFYHDCPILADTVPSELVQARLVLVEAARIGIRVALDLIGVVAPEQM